MCGGLSIDYVCDDWWYRNFLGGFGSYGTKSSIKGGKIIEVTAKEEKINALENYSCGWV